MSKKGMTLFKFEGNSVRVVDKNGNPWFIANEVCRLLSIANVSDAVGRLDEDEKDDVVISDAVGKANKHLIINESGLYALIIRSNKPDAKRFRKWVTSEVLPSIRKTGSYHVDGRSISKSVRNQLTALCKTRGFKTKNDYINLTEKINGSPFGVSKTERVREMFGFPSKSNLREELWKAGNFAELGVITTVEGLTSEQITNTSIYGPRPITSLAGSIGKELRAAISQIRKKLLK